MRWLGIVPNSVDMNLSKLWETVEDREPWRAAVHAVTESHSFLTEQQQSCLYDLSGKSSLLTKALLISKKAPRWLARWLWLQGRVANSHQSLLGGPLPAGGEEKVLGREHWDWQLFLIPVSSGSSSLALLCPWANEGPPGNPCFCHLICKSCMKQPVPPFGIRGVTPLMVVDSANTDTGNCTQVTLALQTQKPNRFRWNFWWTLCHL